MSVRVRFAPSPTGHLHIGGARTALYNYLFARANGGVNILRVEDTDPERSRPEFEKSQIEDMKWLGIEFQEGPENPGEFGPYRQSERFPIYREIAAKWLEEGRAFECFCTPEELEQKKQKAQEEGGDPRYDGTCHHLSAEEIKRRKEGGEKPVIRFKTTEREYSFEDMVRGVVTFPANMVGDFVIMRADGSPVYNYCCVVDDHQMKISHVIRADDHTNNTLRQLMLYEALGARPPVFGHVSLLVGKDRQKLSKRHAATSVEKYREMGLLPQALMNYLTNLGWSHPEEKEIYSLAELGELFSEKRFSKSPATFDMEKLYWVNSHYLKESAPEKLIELLQAYMPSEHFFFAQDESWKKSCLALFIEKINTLSEFAPMIDGLWDEDVSACEEFPEIASWETTSDMAKYLLEQLNGINGQFVTSEDFDHWGQHLKKEMKIKGKPLFKGLRACLTGKGQGPDLKVLVTLVPREVLVKRVQKVLG